MSLDLYQLAQRGPGLFDLVHFTREFVAGRWMTLREIVRPNIHIERASERQDHED